MLWPERFAVNFQRPGEVDLGGGICADMQELGMRCQQFGPSIAGIFDGRLARLQRLSESNFGLFVAPQRGQRPGAARHGHEEHPGIVVVDAVKKGQCLVAEL